MIGLVEKRQQMRIFVSGGAKKIVEDFAEKFDMKEQGVASRIYNWFGSLPLPVQKWICGLTEGDEGEGMKEFAKALVRGGRTTPLKSIPKRPHTAPDELPDEESEQNAGGSGSRRSK